MQGLFLLLLILISPIGVLSDEEERWRLTTSIARQLQSSSVLVLSSNEEAANKLSRASTCSAVIVGAPWDGHFRAFIERGKLQEVVKLLVLDEIDVMLLLYKGYNDTGTDDDFLPRGVWPAETLSSYEMRVFKNNNDRGTVNLRNLDVAELANEIRFICKDQSSTEL